MRIVVRRTGAINLVCERRDDAELELLLCVVARDVEERPARKLLLVYL